jgi:tetratricopeptide (TPR) repeat protein
MTVRPTRSRAQQPARKASPEELRRQKARKLFVEGRKQFSLRKFKTALGLFTRAYAVMPLPGFLYNIAQCHRFLGDCKKANYFYRGYMRDNPGAPNTDVVKKLVARCEAALKEKDLKRRRSAKLFEEARKHHRLGEFKRALDLYAQAYKAAPLPGYLFSMAECHHKLGNFARAVHFYKGYLRDNPGTPKTKLVERLIAECERRAKDAEKRKALARKALNPDLGRTPTGARIPHGRKRIPIYKRWWLWTAVGVAAAAVAVGLTAWFLRPRDEKPWEAPDTTLGTLDWRR